MTALLCFASAAVLTAAGLGLLAASRHGPAAKAPDVHAGPRTHLPEGGCTGPPAGDLFTPNTPPEAMTRYRRGLEEIR